VTMDVAVAATLDRIAVQNPPSSPPDGQQ
jgi:hypothetical protein